MEYPIVLHKDDTSDYGVIVPDVSGCFSAGTTVEEAITNAKEAIECHLEGLLFDEEHLPVPSSIELHKKNEKYADGIWALVYIDLNKISGKTKRVNISLPENILRKIDNYVDSHASNRSAFLIDASLEKMAKGH
ncbi:MAG: type II toxin-antitoxin system HicB family antitoxin [Legionellales bacterium]|nr:type II toxin-antitoxin system HicB family antitoxin [Legionellales bacterium]